MWLKGPELCLSLLFIASYFTNKYVLSVLKFTYPTIFQGWQTFVGSLLLQIAWKLGRVEMRSNVLWSAKVSWIPGALLFVGNIYAGSRALSKLPIPFFLLLQNTSEVVASIFLKITRKEKYSLTKFLSVVLVLIAAVSLPLNDPQFDSGGYFWAAIHCVCAGGCKVFQKLRSYSLSDVEQQYLNYLYSVVILMLTAHPSGDAFGALAFPFLSSYRFHSSCCASAILGVSLMLVSVKMKSYLSTVQYDMWMLLTKVLAALLSLVVFETLLNVSTSCCLMLGVLGEALLVYAERNGAEMKG
ncbi:UDP-N-acetylglucosamine transporter TMEM241 homolog isoform X2 [Heterodontus francisci]|uniref:UDP-N-acetylglucosamine transporter TMEM241 homolog isoform X2 n=1 Tax=Heterodontus francisci TaxID=7792 RepID=UPI00355C5B25